MTPNTAEQPVARRHVGWYDPTAPVGRRLSEHHGWQPAGTIPVYTLDTPNPQPELDVHPSEGVA